MTLAEHLADRRALLVTGLGGLALLAVASAAELVPWGLDGIAPRGVDGRPLLGSAQAWQLLPLAFLMIGGMIVAGAGGVAFLLRMHVLVWPWSRRLAVAAVVGILAGLSRTGALSLGLPNGVSPGFILVETLLASAEAFAAVAIALYFVDARQRIRAEERRRLVEAERAARAHAELDAEELRVRREVSQRLHGGLQQRLVVAAAELEAIGRKLETSGHTSAARSLGQLSETLDEVRERDVRALAHALYPLAAEIDLNAALLLLADQLPASVRLELTFGPAGRPEFVGGAGGGLTAADRVAVFAIVEEGVTNAIRHGRARTIQVALDVEPGRGDEQVILVTVDDDGAGLADASPGLAGLAGLQARARRRGGDLMLAPSPLGGARLSARLPVTPTRHEIDELR